MVVSSNRVDPPLEKSERKYLDENFSRSKDTASDPTEPIG